MLARFADFLETGIEQTNRVGFASYIGRNVGAKTFDVEHILSVKEGNVVESVFSRHELGSLILLPRGRNRSMQSMPYDRKKARYAGENVLAQTLTDGFYENNPQLYSFRDKYGLTELAPIEVFDETAIRSRLALYLKIANHLWTPDRIGEILS